MSDQPLFSVIVPMYKTEAYLPQCVESLRVQTLTNIEIILVDDGSPDDCGLLAEEYALEDTRIRVVHRANGGLGPARNSGMAIARGEYVGFVDADDWVEPTMYEKLYQSASQAQADIVLTGLKTVRHGAVDTVLIQPFAGRILQGEDEIFELRKGFYGAAPVRLRDDPTILSVDVGGYRRAFIEDQGLTFLAIRSEDKFFNIMACRAARTVVCIGGAPYCYRKDDQPSITKTFDAVTIDSFFQLFAQLEKMANEEPSKYQDECRLRVRRCIIDYCRVLVGMIEGSRVNDAAKTAFVREVVHHSMLQQACAGYPFWRLPQTQALFFVCLRLRAVHITRLLMRVRKEFV